jgi:phosphonate transport system substrate-binding protein
MPNMSALRTGSTTRATLLFLLSWVALSGQPAHAADKCENPPVLRFSLIPAGNVEQRVKMYQPLFTRLEKITGRPVSVVRPSSYASVVEGLLSENIDIATLGPAGYVEAKKSNPLITAFATYEKRAGTFQTQGPYYDALLVTLAQNPFNDIGALRGARLALTDPGSTSGSLLPREEFTPRLGMTLERYFGTVSFSGSHDKSLTALLRGEVDAAFIASTQLEEALRADKITREQIRILWKSAPIPYDPFVLRGELCEPLKAKIRAAFLEEPQALRSLLDQIESTRFVPIDDKHYNGIRKVLEKALK